MDPLDEQMRDRLLNHSSKVPDNLWSSIAAQQFDAVFRDRMHNHTEPVGSGVWGDISGHHFDQAIAGRLQDHAAAVSDKMWDRIAKKLHRRDRTPVYILLILLLLLSSGLVRKYTTSKNGNLTPINAERPVGALDQPGEIGTVDGVHSIDKEGEIQPKEAVVAIGEGDKETAMAEVDAMDEVSATVEESIQEENKANEVVGRRGDQAKLGPVVAADDVGTNGEKGAVGTTDRLDKVAATRSQDEAVTTAEERAKGKEVTGDLVSKLGDGFTPMLDEFGQIPTGDFKLLHFDRNPQIKCPNLSVSRQNSLFFELRLNPGYPIRSLKDTSIGGEAADYVSKRKSTESPTSTFGLEALVGLEIKDFEVKTGLAISQVHEVFDHVDQTSSRTIVDTIRDTNGDVIDISVVREYGTRLKRTNNRYTFVDVPLIVGYRLRPREGHSLWIRTGGYLNLAFMRKGTILAPNDDLLDLKESNDFRTTVGLRGMVSIGYELEVTEKNSLGLELMYSHPFNNITQSSATIQQSYQRLLVGFSWKHRLW